VVTTVGEDPMTDTSKMKKKDLAARLRATESAAGELHKIESILDDINVPRQVSPGINGDDQAYDRIIWLLHQGASRQAMGVLFEQRDLGRDAIDRLIKLAGVFAKISGPDPGDMTQPWLIVRWVKENLR